MLRRNFLDSESPTDHSENTETIEEFLLDIADTSQKAREAYGRYFGICSSYHHLKACICRTCPSYPGGTGMFCARGNYEECGKKEGCLCESCELYKKYRLEGEYFCQPKERVEALDGSGITPNICTNFQTSVGTIRICVLGNQQIRTR